MTKDNILLLVVVITAAVLDYKFRKVPNYITIPAIWGGLIICMLQGGVTGVSASMMGLLAGIALLLIPYAKGGIGAGDVKILGAIGAIKGAEFVFVSFLGAAILGGIMAVFRMAFIIKGSDMIVLRDSLKTVCYTGVLSAIEMPEYALKERLPYAIAISGGAIVALILEMS